MRPVVRRGVRRAGVLGTAMMGAVILTAACQSGNHQSGTGSSGSASPSASAKAMAGQNGSQGGGPAGPDRCHTGGLSYATRSMGAAAGHHYAAFQLTNTSGATCRVYGYPGMQLLGGQSAKIATNVVRDQQTKPVLITLAPGQSAWFRAGWGVVPGPGDSQTGNCQPEPSSVEITPPDETDYHVMNWSYGPVCESGTITVTALTAGTAPAGQQG